jgi:preprotein translocase subunit SecY
MNGANWRQISLALGVVLLIAGIALLVGHIGSSSLGLGILFAGALAALIGLAPEQLFVIYKIPELKYKIGITLLLLAVYRIGYYIPLPMIDQVKVAETLAQGSGGTLGNVLGFVSMFSGGNLSNGCIFALGIMPYISASIILQLLSTGVLPALEKLRKEGASGQKKINEYTRYLTVPICIAQAIMILRFQFFEQNFLIAGYNPFFSMLGAVTIITAGTLFLMWIGEQIDEFGIGNGISLIIMAGIIARIPDAIGMLIFEPGTTTIKDSIFTLGSGGTGDVSLEKLILLVMLFVGVIVGVIAMTKAKRNIMTQSQKFTRGRRQFGGGKQGLPVKVNAAGVMPVIFASTLLIVPGFLFNIIGQVTGAEWAYTAGNMFQRGSGWVYNVAFIVMIYLFTYFWVAIQFNPQEIADNLKDHGSFIPGYRPGKSTADYLEKVILRITYVGAAFLAIIAVIPSIMNSELGIDYRVAGFFGGTGLLIVISVALDLVTKINSHLVMRNYPGLTEE